MQAVSAVPGMARAEGRAALLPGAIQACRARALDVALLAALGALALALRLPYLQLAPVFTNETVDLYRALLITRGKLFPLVEASSYNGSLWTWLAAAAYWISGDSLYAPRTLIMAFGVLTVAATYLLGRAWGGRWAGTLAAALLSTSASHIVVNSHIAWSNCVTPLFSTLGAWALYSATGRRSDGVTERHVPSPRRPVAPSLLAAGLLWGLAVQTHPSALALLPGAAIFLLTQGRPLLRTRWPYLAAALFLMINLNLVIYNLTNGFDSVATGLRHSRQLTQEEHLTPQVYLGRLRELGIGLLLDLGGDVALHESDDAFLDPGLLLIALVAGAGVVWQWRRGNRLPGLLLASMALLLPLFNGSYQPIWFRGRYLMPLLPLLFAGGGSLGAAALERLGNLGRDRSPALARLGLLGLGLATAYLLLHPLLYLRTYYDQVIGNSRDNTQFFHTLAQLKAHRQSEETIILSQDFADTWRPGVGGRLAFAFRLALAVENLPYRILDPTSSELLDRNSRCRDRFVILAFHRHEVDESVLTGLDLRRLDHSRVDLRAEQASHGPFRLDRLPGAPPTC